jgi:hypothetical protein
LPPPPAFPAPTAAPSADDAEPEEDEAAIEAAFERATAAHQAAAATAAFAVPTAAAAALTQAAAASAAAAAEALLPYAAAFRHLLSEEQTRPFLGAIQPSAPDPGASCLARLFAPTLRPGLRGERDAIFCAAKAPFDAKDATHAALMRTLYRQLTGAEAGAAVTSWQAVGFQRDNDFTTDLRGAGMLGPLQVSRRAGEVRVGAAPLTLANEHARCPPPPFSPLPRRSASCRAAPGWRGASSQRRRTRSRASPSWCR